MTDSRGTCVHRGSIAISFSFHSDRSRQSRYTNHAIGSSSVRSISHGSQESSFARKLE